MSSSAFADLKRAWALAINRVGSLGLPKTFSLLRVARVPKNLLGPNIQAADNDMKGRPAPGGGLRRTASGPSGRRAEMSQSRPARSGPMKPNRWPATLRIWISSEPSVMR